MLSRFTISYLIVKAVAGTMLMLEKLSLSYYCAFSVIALVIFYNLSIKKQHQKRWAISMTLIELSLPLYGSLALLSILISTIVLKHLYDKELESNAQVAQAEFDQLIFNKNIELEARSIKNNQSDISLIKPYLDIFNGDNENMKVDACIKLSSNPSQQSVELLNIALQDEEYNVRYMASNALGSIEKKYMDKIDYLSELITTYPTNFDNFLARGDTYLYLHSSNLLDKTLNHYFLNKSLSDFRHVLVNKPNDYNILIKIAYIYNALKDYESLIQMYQKSKLLEIPSNEMNKIAFYAAEAFFYKKDFDQTTNVLKQLDMKKIKYDKILLSANYWRGNDANA